MRVDWGSLSLEQAQNLDASWVQTRASRLDWLRAELGVADLASEDAHHVGRWHFTWHASNPRHSQPSPTWWTDTAGIQVSYSESQSVGFDALMHFREHVLFRQFPRLERMFPTGTKTAKDVFQHQPCMWLPGNIDSRLPTLIEGYALKISRGQATADTFGELVQGNSRMLQAAAPKDASPSSLPDRYDADIEITKSTEPGFKWQIEIDDVTAHEREPEIHALLAALRAEPSVKAVAHADREVILVDGGVRLTRTRLEQLTRQHLQG